MPFQAGWLWSLEVTGAIDVTGTALCEGVRGLPEAFPIFCLWFQKVLRAMVFVRELFQPGKGLLSGPAPCLLLCSDSVDNGRTWLSTEHGLLTGTQLKPRTPDSNKSSGPTDLDSALSVNQEANPYV